MRRRILTWTAVIAGLLVLATLLSEFQRSLLTEVLLAGLFAMSLNLLLGYGGMVSFGHSAYYGVGAYTVAIATVHYDVPPLLALIAAPFVSALVALVVGWFCVRLVELYFSILTLAFGQLFYILILQGGEWTGGDNGLLGVPVPMFLQTELAFCVFTIFVVMICLLVMRWLTLQPFMLTIRAIRDNAERAQFIGVDTRRYQLAVFVIAAFFAGAAGGVLALHHRLVAVDMLFWTTSAEPLIGSLLGGMGVFAGPMIGGGLLAVLEVVLGRFTIFWSLALGLLTVAILLVAPSGLLGINWRQLVKRVLPDAAR